MRNPGGARPVGHADGCLDHRDPVPIRFGQDLDFELESPAGYFPAIAGMWVSRPVPQWTIESAGAKSDEMIVLADVSCPSASTATKVTSCGPVSDGANRTWKNPGPVAAMTSLPR